MKLMSARRTGRTARRAGKTWLGWRAAKKTLPRVPDRRSTAGLVAAGGAGAAIGWLLSKLDTRRRHMAVDRTAAAARSAKDSIVRKADYTAGKAKGPVHAMASATRDDREYDDTTLARKVESEIFRPADAPKDRVSVNVADGIVELRGEVKRPEQVKELEEAASRVEGVRGVHNLLHTPGAA